jgi:hypothetical protein
MQICYEKPIKKMSRLLLLLCFCLCIRQNIIAQLRYVSGLFPTIDHSGSITRNVNYSLYYFGAFPLLNLEQPNISKDADFLLFYAEQALTFQANKHFSFTGAYVYQREKVTKDIFLNENRIHLQATYQHTISTAQLKHRLRFDNRFIKGSSTEQVTNNHRLRYLAGLTIPINNRKNNLYFTAYEEMFFNTFKNPGKVYGENWAYAAIGIQLDSKNKFETGPLYITWNTGNRTWFHQYYLQLSWISHIDFIN